MTAIDLATAKAEKDAFKKQLVDIFMAGRSVKDIADANRMSRATVEDTLREAIRGLCELVYRKNTVEPSTTEESCPNSPQERPRLSMNPFPEILPPVN